MKFRPDIEGLRALAILPVVAFHAFPQWVPGGFVGVDVFFVISGFLITQLLLQKLSSGEYSIASFYAARVRRIFPALFFMLAATVPLAVTYLAPQELKSFGRTLGATALFYSNMSLYRTTDYFDAATELKPLVHTWSLAVEEQYYIAFPVLLALLYRHWRRRTAMVLGVVGISSLALSIWWTRHDTQFAFYSALSRTFELMTGSFLAVNASKIVMSKVTREITGNLGLALIIASCFLLTPQWPFPGPSALLPCVGAALLIGAGCTGTGWAGLVVGTPILRWFGAVSFSLYLWHWPILTFTRHFVLGEPQEWQTASALALALALAYLSLRWIEGPVRRARLSNLTLLVAGGICTALACVVGWCITTGSLRQMTSPQQAALYAGATDVSPERHRCHGGQKQLIAYPNRCVFGDPKAGRQIAVWADSHGVELAFALGEVGQGEGFSVAQITSSGCPPAPGFEVRRGTSCVEHNAATLEALQRDSSVSHVVLAARFSHYLKLDSMRFAPAFERTVMALGQAGKKVLIVEPMPSYEYPVPQALWALSRRDAQHEAWGTTAASYRRNESATFEILSRVARLPNVKIWAASAALCDGTRCVTAEQGRPLYFDDNHLSMQGARRLVRAFPGAW